MGMISFALSLLLFGATIHVCRHLLIRDVSFPFSESFWLGVGVKLAVFGVTFFLGGVLGPLVLAPAFFAAWGVLARYGKFSDLQALACVGILVALDVVWMATGLSHVS